MESLESNVNSEKMKILIASDAYKKQTNGVTNMVVMLAEELRRRGYPVKVLALSDTHSFVRDGDDYYVPSFSSPVYPDARQSAVVHSRFLRELKQWNPDIIHIHTEFSASRLAKQVAHANHTPYVMTSHTDYGKFIQPKLHSRRLIRRLIRFWSYFAYHNAKVLTVPSEKGRSITNGYRLNCPVVVIPNGIRLEQFQRELSPEDRAALFAQYGLRDNGKLLVALSRLSPEKNLEEIVGYMPALLEEEPDVQLMIVGDGPDRTHLEAQARKLGLLGSSVVFTGRVPPEEVYRYYRMGSLFVCASNFEVHSLTYLEAMTCALPLLCREDPCLEGVLEEGENGFSYRTEREFIDHALNILRDDTLRQALSAGAVAKSDEFSVQRYVDRTLALYEKVLNENRSCAGAS